MNRNCTASEAWDLSKDHMFYFKPDATLEQKLDALTRTNWYGSECDTCGHSLVPFTSKTLGFYEDIEHEVLKLCAICFQADVVANKETFHKKPANWIRPISLVFLLGVQDKRTACWQVLTEEPWLDQIKKLESREMAIH